MNPLVAGGLALVAFGVINEQMKPAKYSKYNMKNFSILSSGGLARMGAVDASEPDDVCAAGVLRSGEVNKCQWDRAIANARETCASTGGKVGVVCNLTVTGWESLGNNINGAYNAVKGLF